MLPYLCNRKYLILFPNVCVVRVLKCTKIFEVQQTQKIHVICLDDVYYSKPVYIH